MGNVDSPMLYGEILPTNPADIQKVRTLLAGHPHELELINMLGLS